MNRTAITLMMILGLFGCAKDERQDDSALANTALPLSWYRLNEAEDNLSFESPHRTVRASFQKLLLADVQAVDEISARPSPPDSDWRLTGMMANFSVSLEGTIGALLVGGTPSVELKWESVDAGRGASRLRVAGIRLRSTTTESEMAAKFEPAVRAILATGKISQASQLRENLVLAGRKFREICQILASLRPGAPWSPSEFRLEFEVDSSGQVTPVTGVTGGVTLRLDWLREESSSQEAVIRGARLDAPMAAFVSGFSQLIDEAVRENAELRPGFPLTEVKVILGISAEGDVGIAQASGAVSGTLVFTKNPEGGDRNQALLASRAKEEADTISLLTNHPNEEARRYAQAHTIAIHEAHWGKSTGSTFRIERRRLRHGLGRAIRMANWLVDAAGDVRTSRWRIIEVSSEFELSAGGTLGLVTASGTSAVELTFIRSENPGQGRL